MYFFNRFDTKRTLLSFKVIFIFGVLIISTKQLVRIYKYYDTRNFVPNHIFISNKSFTNKYKKIILKKYFSIYISEDECFFGLSPCSNEINHIKNATKKNYFLIKYFMINNFFYLSLKEYLIMQHNALKVSFSPIFFPSSYDLP